MSDSNNDNVVWRFKTSVTRNDGKTGVFYFSNAKAAYEFETLWQSFKGNSAKTVISALVWNGNDFSEKQ